MSDEHTRTPQGSPPPPRRPSEAPAWWSELRRADLPDDAPMPVPAAGMVELAARARPAGRPPRRAAQGEDGDVLTAGAAPPASPSAPSDSRVRTWAVSLLVVIAALLVTWVGVGAGSWQGLLVVTAVFGIPAALTAVTIGMILRHAR